MYLLIIFAGRLMQDLSGAARGGVNDYGWMRQQLLGRSFITVQ
jgi:hypothetical protein